MKRQITQLTPESRERLRACEMRHRGATFREIAEEFDIHQSTASEWWKRYQQGGPDSLNAPRRPRPIHNVSPSDVEAAMVKASGKDKEKCRLLLAFLQAKTQAKAEAKTGKSRQYLMRLRTQFEKGEFPS